MRIRFGGASAGHSQNVDASTTRYVVSVVDSDGDSLLVDAAIQASDYVAAWNQAILIALRACHGSGAVPMTLTLVRAINDAFPARK